MQNLSHIGDALRLQREKRMGARAEHDCRGQLFGLSGGVVGHASPLLTGFEIVAFLSELIMHGVPEGFLVVRHVHGTTRKYVMARGTKPLVERRHLNNELCTIGALPLSIGRR